MTKPRCWLYEEVGNIIDLSWEVTNTIDLWCENRLLVNQYEEFLCIRMHKSSHDSSIMSYELMCIYKHMNSHDAPVRYDELMCLQKYKSYHDAPVRSDELICIRMLELLIFEPIRWHYILECTFEWGCVCVVPSWVLPWVHYKLEAGAKVCSQPKVASSWCTTRPEIPRTSGFFEFHFFYSNIGTILCINWIIHDR